MDSYGHKSSFHAFAFFVPLRELISRKGAKYAQENRKAKTQNKL